MPRPSLRRFSALLALATAAAATLTLAPALAQSEEPDPAVAEEAPTPVVVATDLTRGDALATGTWELTVGETFAAPSPIRHGYTEVRVAVVMKNVGGSEALYRPDGFFTDPAYPRLGVLDGSGTERALTPASSTLGSAPGSWLNGVPPGMTARWTIGFQVPTSYADTMSLLVHGDSGTAAFDLASATSEAATGPASGAEVIGIGQSIDWGDAFEVTAFDHGTAVCGDPATQHVLQVLAVGFEVGNVTAFDADWPGVRFPDNLAIAQWADGGSARFAFETFSGNFEPLLKWAEDATRFPAGGDGVAPAQTYRRAMLFAVPRDSRVGSVTEGPVGVWMQPPGADPMWLELDGQGTLELSPALCDAGNLPFTIPFAFGPGAEFIVGDGVDTADPAAQDRAATELLSEATVVAGTYYAGNDDSFADITADALNALTNTVGFDSGFVASVGAVGVDEIIGANDTSAVLLVTESASGVFLCGELNPGGFTIQSAPTLDEVRVLCAAAEQADEEAVAAEEVPEETG